MVLGHQKLLDPVEAKPLSIDKPDLKGFEGAGCGVLVNISFAHHG
jgi:hypothetical protein